MNKARLAELAVGALLVTGSIVSSAYLHAASAATTGAPIKARIDNAVYDWWAQPVSVNDGAYTWIGTIATGGTVRVAKVSPAAGTYQWATLTSVGDIYHDEHNTPALAFEPTKPYLMAFYTQHGADNIMRYRTINRTTLAMGRTELSRFPATSHTRK